MKASHQIFGIILAAMFLLTGFSGCENNAPSQSDTIRYTSFRDVPGVTKEEINAIEALRKQTEYFIYGMCPATEAFYGADNKIHGFSALFCAWLTELFGIQFKPALYGWGDLLEGLKSGKIDFSGELTATTERRKIYYMTGTIANRSVKTFRLAASQPLAEIAKSRPIRYVFLEGTTTVDDVTALLQGAYKLVLVRDYDAAYQKLKNGEGDALVNEGAAEAAFDTYGDVVAEDFLPLIYSPVSMTTQNPDLAPIISVVQKALQNGGVRHLSELYNLGYRQYMKHKLFTKLSMAERDYITNHPIVRFAAEYENYPMSFYNIRDQEWQGIVFDVLREIEELTGLSFSLANGPRAEWPELLQMLNDGKVSLVSELIRTPEREGRYLWPKVILLADHYALISKTEHRNIKINEMLSVKVGLPRNTAYAEVFQAWFPYHTNTIVYEGSDIAFTALARGEVDMIMSSQYKLLALTNLQEQTGYKANVVFSHFVESTFGLNIHETVLCSIIDKALTMIDTQGIAGRWTRKTYDYRTKLAQSLIPWVTGATALSLLLLFMFAMHIRNHNEGKRLDKLVQARTAELRVLQGSLEAALKATEAASRAKSDFLANMSHEIRTPLNAIIGMTAIGKSSTDMERKDYCFTRIGGASDHLLGVIDDILDMSKIEANKLELSAVEFSFEDMLRRVANVVSFRVDEKQQKFMVHIDNAIPKTLIGDDQRMAQVITNLIGNAIKFTPDGGSISLNTRLLGEENKLCTIQIEVTDTGIGISPGQQARLFASFQQAETSTTRKFGGTGLGLVISKNIVEMMGGRIWIESELGKGATFAFTVQAQRGAEQKAEPPVNIRWDELRILAVDDDPDILMFFEETIRRFGAYCDTAKSGEDALALVEHKGDYHFYFVDWKMPGIDGTQLTKALRAKEANFGSVVIMISAADLSIIEEEAKKAGVDEFLSKPLFPSAIMDIMMQILGDKRQQAELDQKDAVVSYAGSRILLVEDIELNREIVLALLEPIHVEIDCAENGAEGVRMFSEAPMKYDMILMDLQMPEMDGYEATRQIRALDAPRAKEIPIVAMTANVFREDVERCMEAGMNAHVGKPLNFDDVLAMLHRYLPDGKASLVG